MYSVCVCVFFLQQLCFLTVLKTWYIACFQSWVRRNFHIQHWEVKIVVNVIGNVHLRKCLIYDVTPDWNSVNTHAPKLLNRDFPIFQSFHDSSKTKTILDYIKPMWRPYASNHHPLVKGWILKNVQKHCLRIDYLKHGLISTLEAILR